MSKKIRISVLCVLLSIVVSCWGGQPKAEHPRPQFEREQWLNLNGQWTYKFDFTDTGLAENNPQSKGFDKTITVPFAPESKLSGVGYTGFIPSIWYHRTIQIPTAWKTKKININFGAVYYESEIYIDGQLITRHFGGSDSFSVDITKFVNDGETHHLVVQSKSDVRSRMQTAGKQSLQLNSWGCNYTRTTGIWQTVWMDAIDMAGLESVVYLTDIDSKQLIVTPTFNTTHQGYKFIVTVKSGGKQISRCESSLANGVPSVLTIKNMKLWSPEDPYLYDVVLQVADKQGNILDEVKSYVGMRKVHIEGNKIYLNNEAYYQRLVLDQGFYPDGIWTSPNDDALKNDILLSKQAGFNGARLHQKVFEERFHYWADKLGYITWGESASWGMDANNEVVARNFISEWSNIVTRDRNHPSILIWTAMNEQWWPEKAQYPRFVEDVYNLTRNLDPTRPVNTVSGGVHIRTDIWTVHNYQQDGAKLKQELYNGSKFQQTPNNLQQANYGNVGFNHPKDDTAYNFKEYTGGIPYLIDEFGGIKCLIKQPEGNSWGYGDAAKTEEEFYQRLESQVDAILSLHQQVWGFCYTQLTDVEQEQNGIYYYDRKSKFDMKRLHSIFSKSLPQTNQNLLK